MNEQSAIRIYNRQQYDEIIKQYPASEPLMDPEFIFDIRLRKEIQDSIFGSDETDPNNRRKMFLWIWERRPHVCEETGAYLGDKMEAVFMSHILSRGAFIEMWNDPRNINILTPDSHRKWEEGKKEKMRIWDKNKDRIRELKADYSLLKKYNIFPKGNSGITGEWTDEKIIEKSRELYPMTKPRNYLNEGGRSGFIAGMKFMRDNKKSN